MKRDMELVRKILLYLESKDKDHFMGIIKIEGYEKKEIDYHLQLMLDAGLLKGELLRGGNKVLSHGVAMHWNGHEFLDASRDDSVWNKFKEKIGPEIQSIPFTIMIGLLKDLSKEYFKNKLGLK
jgi:hypothetical protein